MASYVGLLAFAFSMIQLAASGDLVNDMMKEIGMKCYDTASENSTLSEEGRTKIMELLQEIRHEIERAGEKPMKKAFRGFSQKLKEKIDAETTLTDKDEAHLFVKKFKFCMMTSFREQVNTCKEEVEGANNGTLTKEERKQLQQILMDVKREVTKRAEEEVEKKLADNFEGEKLEAARKTVAAHKDCYRSFVGGG